MNRRLSAKCFVVITLLFTVHLANGMALAGTITFVDLTDTITLSDDTGRTSGFSCIDESCVVTITGPTGTNAEVGQFITLQWAEPGTNILSDEFCIGLFGCTFVPTGTATITFSSDNEAGSLGTCPTNTLTPCGVENGSVQTALTVSWYHQVGSVFTLLETDSIGFQSDIEAIPELASALLLLAGVGVVALARRRPGY